MQQIESLGYKVYFEDDLASLQSFIADGGYSNVLILVDINTNDHCLPVLQAAIPEIVDYDIIEVDPGEENKNIDYCIGIWKTMLDFGADRKALMINLGGGVVTDMGGFAASTYKRGIDFIQIPTTLLAQVDASVGGKTGIDLDNFKNIIGTFTQPKAVFISSKFLESLDSRQLLSGFAEVIKHGLIQDKALFQRCQQINIENIDKQVVYDSVMIKNNIVKEDPTENNIRKILNFGHTIGHAVEGYSLTHDQNPLLHGEAVAIGMLCEAYLSTQSGTLSMEELKGIEQYLLRTYPYYTIAPSIDEELFRLMRNDKKNESNQIGFALLNAIGDCAYNKYVDEAGIKAALDYYRTLDITNP
ncbi:MULTISPECIES: 3-dehydroquinate synthase [Sphingobacterium]|uniref:3-dehydroquinate synthase n=1 Tax=Sphingobacterium populi TaxID=1812824 RepID=A0ABW5UEG0_9SPHI|nr:3-dehydroquinate synthase [Sphingobacterium sp. CFCC 11742]